MSLLLAQRDYKRMLAYSSIEHMALLALGAAVGGGAASAAILLHMLGHGLAKSVLFLGAGRVLQTTATSRIAEVRGWGQPAGAGGVVRARRARPDRATPVQHLRQRAGDRPSRPPQHVPAPGMGPPRSP